ncbi:Uncharacterised protein [Corynebacterium kutscheri]|uniref:Uncharacterized protein n=1 Tax=Corynebacterium kutscheri TaxID=35755 RepID=A0A0F6R158_9CORY|nr:hypothetical protein [Corynebacterium kutscheri]AKE41680.1 hypothetical protein UL82_07595 [Corynebacterium kutscheri]VEH08956.1 Uncharacterised protein [Corynebacterium kutscheri]VEH10007.1 Uncharacterised protein [Corynebacterium kutscheri]VEH80088.1 Uncharacterised protein [Corynebacterium kutscheri]
MATSACATCIMFVAIVFTTASFLLTFQVYQQLIDLITGNYLRFISISSTTPSYTYASTTCFSSSLAR